MSVIKRVDEEIYLPSEKSILDLLSNKEEYLNMFIFLSYRLPIVCLIAYFFVKDSALSIALLSIGVSSVLILPSLEYYFKNGTPPEENSVLVPNNYGQRFFFNFGKEVYKHLGNARKSEVPSNLTGKLLLLSAEIVKRMGAIVGTTGSGKTVLLQGLNRILCLGGFASLITDAKGTFDEFKKTYAIWWSTGRENDGYLINLLNPNNSHSIAFFKYGTATQLTEASSILIENDDPNWGGVEKAFIKNLLKVLVYQRDYEGVNLKPSLVTEYFSMISFFKLAWDYKNHDHIDLIDFCKYVCSSIGVDYQEFIRKNDSAFKKSCEERTKDLKIQGVYNNSVGAGKWSSYMELLSSKYGKIFNEDDSDIDFYDAVINKKNIWTIMPTMESDENARQMGKLFLGFIKMLALMKIEKQIEPEFPYVIFFDEFGSMVSKGFGLLMSKSRSLGLAIWLMFQSKSQLMEVGETEYKQIMDMCNNLFVLKIMDDEFAEGAMKFLKKQYVLRRNYSEGKESLDKKAQNPSSEHSYNLQENGVGIEVADIVNMNLGEMMFFSGSNVYKAVATKADLKLTFRHFKTEKEDLEFPLVQTIPKDRFIETMNRFADRYFIHNPRYKEVA